MRQLLHDFLELRDTFDGSDILAALVVRLLLFLERHGLYPAVMFPNGPVHLF